MINNDFNQFYLYSNKEAVDGWCLYFTQEALKFLRVPEENIRKIQSMNEIPSTNIKETTVIIPGGSSALLFIDTHKEAEKVHKYVKEGGSIIGTCSGSMSLTKQLVKGNRLSPQRPIFTLHSESAHGPLGIVPIISKWPVFRDELGKAKEEGMTVSIEVPFKVEALKMPFYAGPKFQVSEDFQGEVIATYKDVSHDNIAAWHTSCGDGKVIGIGFHPELPLPGEEKAQEEGLEFLKDELKYARSLKNHP